MDEEKKEGKKENDGNDHLVIRYLVPIDGFHFCLGGGYFLLRQQPRVIIGRLGGGHSGDRQHVQRWWDRRWFHRCIGTRRVPGKKRGRWGRWLKQVALVSIDGGGGWRRRGR